MENEQIPKFSVADFIASANQILEYAYPSVIIEGEVESFKVNQNKYVFFNLKDTEASVGCFMMLFSLRTPIEDGMKVVVKARPRLTEWGRFSLNVDTIRPSGEGSIKKSFELLKSKLEKEGLFAPERKRLLPHWPKRVAVISSIESAGYIDFMKIANQRLGGVEFTVYHTTVQGDTAPTQIEKAIKLANEASDPADVLVLIRGGGSADDLAAFSDEMVVRALAGSRIPTLIGVGHEVDVSLADMVADVRAATPTDAADILLPSKHEIMLNVQQMTNNLSAKMQYLINDKIKQVDNQLLLIGKNLQYQIELRQQKIAKLNQLLSSYNPEKVLSRGYAIIRGKPDVGNLILIETAKEMITAKVESYDRK